MPRNLLDEMEEASELLRRADDGDNDDDDENEHNSAGLFCKTRLEKTEGNEQRLSSFNSDRTERNYCDRQYLCEICSRLPLRRPHGLYSKDVVLENMAQAMDWDDGMLDFLRNIHEYEFDADLPPELVSETVEHATAHLNKLKKSLTDCGIQRHKNQNYSCQSLSSARVVAPLDVSEIEIGRVLGSGGFGVVCEVRDIHLRDADSSDRSCNYFSDAERQSRLYLASHAHIRPSRRSEKHALGSSPSKVTDEPFVRYAIKHIRGNLVQKSHDKFRRAAGDLAREAQILMVLDHPAIVAIRGWACDGPAAFRGGRASNFFLIMDRLTCTLEEKLWDWRQTHRLYAIRSKRRITWRGRSKRFKSLLSCSSFPITDDEVPDKYVVKMMSLFVGRLTAARALASAVAHMHAKRMIHRDLKTSNIGFDVHGDLKLFDFGLARLLPSDENKRSANYLMSRVGSTFYMSPEILRKEPYGTAADTYSFGVILWEILSMSSARDTYQRMKESYLEAERRKRVPLNNYPKVRRMVKNGEEGTWLPICSCWSNTVQHLIKRVQEDDPKQRFSMNKVHSSLADEIESLSNLLCQELPESRAPKRRRSTFRVDLSHIHRECNDDDSGTGCLVSSATQRLIIGDLPFGQ